MNYLILNLFLSFLIFFITYTLPTKKKLKFLIYDDTAKKHSINKKTVPLISSLTLLPSIFFYYEFDLLLIFISLLLFFIGYLDDKFHLKIKFRFLLSLFLIIFFLINFKVYRIDYIYFYNYYINFTDFYSLIITLIMILGFFHVINMSDGRNCLVVLYFINIFIFLVFNNESPNLSNNLFILTSLLLVFILNYFNKSFFGNSGILFLSLFVAVVLISEFNNDLLSIENIFILLYLPFYDALRVTFIRIFNKKSPFLSEKNHLHHLPKNWNLALIFLITLFVFNHLIQLFTNFNFFIIFTYSILSFLIIYKIFSKI